MVRCRPVESFVEPIKRKERKMRSTSVIRTYLPGLCVAAVALPEFAEEGSNIEIEKGTDYSNNDNWSIKCEDIKHDVDVFFVHPTTYGPPANGKYIADLNDKKLNEETDSSAVNILTAVFAESCNVFAPRFRQVNEEMLQMPEEKKAGYMNIPVSDIKAAFTYFIENLNNGRPFILASHSQGSNVLQLILLENPDLLNKDKLVAAYLVGWTFTDDDMKKMDLKLSTTPNQTGGLITWNTIGPSGKSPTLSKGARCVNPLSWTTDTNEYQASMNKSAKIQLTDGEEVVIDFTSARINNSGALEIPTPKPEIVKKLNLILGKQCYHRYDYDFFFYNIVDNVAHRCKAYLDMCSIKYDST